MLNLFINSTTFGQAMGATFDMSVEGSFADKRVTPDENIEVLAPIYERVIDANRITALIQSGQTQKVSNLGKAVEVENIRVNSLNVLIRELNMISAMESTGVIIAYLPTELLQEIESGRIKFYLNDSSAETTYYSKTELELWAQAIPLIQNLYSRIVFKNIASCRKNVSNTQVQADRVAIVASMQSKLLTAFREMKALRNGAQAQQSNPGEVIF